MATTGLGLIGRTTSSSPCCSPWAARRCASSGRRCRSLRSRPASTSRSSAVTSSPPASSARRPPRPLRVAGLDEGACAKPGLPCIEAMEGIVVREEDKRSSLAELWLQYAMTCRRRSANTRVRPGQDCDHRAGCRLPAAPGRVDAGRAAGLCLSVLHRAHREPAGVRGPPDPGARLLQPGGAGGFGAAVRCLCHRARAQHGPTTSGWAAGPSCWPLQTKHRRWTSAPPAKLVPAASLSFTGTLRSVHRRDGFGAELVAVMDDPPAARLPPPPAAAQAAQAGRSATQSWSEMPSPSMTVLLRFERTCGSAA